MTENELSRIIIGAAIEVHKEMGGPGLIEDVYEEALCEELIARGLTVTRQKRVPIFYKGKRLRKPLYLDILVNDKVIVEAKSAKEFHPVFAAQLLTYLRLTGKKLGLVINFGEIFLKNGIHRVVNGLS
jgi:GxxExxY protein